MSLRYVDLGTGSEDRTTTEFAVALLTPEEWGPARPARRGREAQE